MPDQETNARWLETLKREKRAKETWQRKYLTAEEKERTFEEEEAELAALKENMSNAESRSKRMSERDACELRLAALNNEAKAAQEAPRPMSTYEAARRKVAEDVAATRPMSHRFSGDFSTRSLLHDIGPGMWASINSSAL